MDFFYKPPQERPDECAALEENYMNCLLQKALKDRVVSNRCRMDSILWFHLECPKARDKFDNPVDFRLKWRDWFAEQNRDAAVYFDKSETTQRVRREFDAHLYPEDVVEREAATAFFKEQQAHDPVLHPEMDSEDTDTLVEAPESRPPNQRKFGTLEAPPILSVADSDKFSGKL